MRHALKYIILGLACISFLTVASLVFRQGIPLTYDGPTHLTTYYQAGEVLRDGPEPLTWLNNFSTYGSPIPIFIQQLPLYLGALLSLVTGSPWVTYIAIVFIASMLGGTGMYFFLRQHVAMLPALLGSILFLVAPYRILNIYSRGALPELLAASFVPWVLLSMRLLMKRPSKWHFVSLVFSTAFLILSHPFMLIIALPLIIVYGASLIASQKNQRGTIIKVLIALVLGFGLTLYTLVPLSTEMSYFYFGSEKNHAKENQYLSLVDNFVMEKWTLPREEKTGPKAHIVQSGSIEFGLLVIVSILLLQKPFRHIFKRSYFLIGICFLGFFYMLMQLEVTWPLYEALPLLGNIQHQWRMMSGFQFVAPILIAYMSNSFPRYRYVWWGIIIVVLLMRIPQMDGKNYASYPNEHYAYVQENLHGNAMTPVWSGQADHYPPRTVQYKVIGGDGVITDKTILNNSRQYTVKAATDVRMVDYTFYFPGWEVFVDGKPVPVEFQDPSYRGLITYGVPAGRHKVEVAFGQTTKRLAGVLLSLASLAVLGILLFAPKKLLNKVHFAYVE